MELTLERFNFKNNEINVLQDESGDPWFLTKEVCDVLGIKDYKQAAYDLDETDRCVFSLKAIKGYNTQPKAGQPRRLFISESGLYNLIFASRKPEAQMFKRWVTSEVLPNIRKHGYHVEKRNEEVPDYVQIMQNDISAMRNDLHKFATAMMQLLNTDNKQALPAVEPRPVREPEKYMTLKEFLDVHEISCDRGARAGIGRGLRYLAQSRGVEIKRQDHDVWGVINLYPASLLTAYLPVIQEKVG